MKWPGIVFLILLSWSAKAQTVVRFYTNMGNFEVMLYDSLTPITAGNFKGLVESNYYDNTIFHRVIDNFMIQGGDPTGTGSGGPGYTIEDEFDTSLSNMQMTISMANSGPNTGGSQFFINLVDNQYLDFNKPPYTSKHPVFGIVTDSFEVVQRIGKVATNINNRPRTPVVIDSIRVMQPNSICELTSYIGNGLTVKGNPINEASILELFCITNGAYQLTITDLLGNTYSVYDFEIEDDIMDLPLHTLLPSNLSKGIYVIRVTGGDHFSAFVKVVVN